MLELTSDILLEFFFSQIHETDEEIPLIKQEVMFERPQSVQEFLLVHEEVKQSSARVLVSLLDLIHVIVFFQTVHDFFGVRVFDAQTALTNHVQVFP